MEYFREIKGKASYLLNNNRFSLLSLLFLWLVIILLRPPLQWTAIMILFYIAVMGAVSLRKQCIAGKPPKSLPFGKKLITSSLWALFFIHLVYYLNALLGPYGFLGLLGLATIIVLFRIIRTWKQFVEVKHEGERALFGMTIRERHERKKKEQEEELSK